MRVQSWRFAAVVLLAATVGAVVLPGAANASVVRYRGISEFSTAPAKSAVAECPLGSRVLGAGGRVEMEEGRGGVALTAVEPDPSLTFVTASAQARSGHRTPWSVVAVAICANYYYHPVLVSSVMGPTARCTGLGRVTGTGFRLNGQVDTSYLTGVIPNPDLASVTVQVRSTAQVWIVPTAYAICDTELNTYQQMSPMPVMDASTPKVATAGVRYEYARFMGVGGVIVGPAERVFIDTLVPNDDLTEATVHAVRAPLMIKPIQPWSMLDDDEDDGFSVGAYGTSGDYNYF